MEEKLTIFDKIRQKYPDFSRQQKAIADFLLERGVRSAFLTTKEIAEAVNTSSATVVRFTQYLGYDSFNNFSEDLQQIVLQNYRPMRKLKESLESSETESGKLTSACHYELDNINNILSSQQEHSFQKAVESMVNADRIFLIGARSAFSLVHYGGFVLRDLVKNVYFYPSGSESIYENLEDISSRDALISICFHRYAISTVEVTRFAHSKNANIIAITDGVDSPLNLYSEIILSAPNNAPFYSYIPAMVIINGLIWAFAKEKKELIERGLDKRLQMLLDNGIFY